MTLFEFFNDRSHYYIASILYDVMCYEHTYHIVLCDQIKRLPIHFNIPNVNIKLK